MLKRAWLGIGLVGTMSGIVPVRAQLLVSSARQMEPRSLKFALYYQGTEGQDLNFNVTGGGTCTGGATPPGSNVVFPCSSTGVVPATADGGKIVLKALYQPWDSLQYYASVGVGDMTLRISSISATNVLTGDRPGYEYALGARAVIVPDTVVGPAVAIDGRIGWQQYYFNMAQPATAGVSIDQRMDLYQYQVALETSHRFDFTEPSKWSIEPYGGVKWLRSQAYLKDLKGGGRVGGAQDTITPFVGVTVPLYEHESLVAEGSFVHGYQYSAGLQIKL